MIKKFAVLTQIWYKEDGRKIGFLEDRQFLRPKSGKIDEINANNSGHPRHSKSQHHHIPTDEHHTFDTLCLADIKPKKTWVEVHEEFYREPPKNPGKILLLYSRDSKAFTDLQQAFRR
jgi:hypothetical protein